MEHIKTKVEVAVKGSELPIRFQSTNDPDVVLVDAVVFDGEVHISDLLVAITKLKIDSYEELPTILEDEMWRMNG